MISLEYAEMIFSFFAIGTFLFFFFRRRRVFFFTCTYVFFLLNQRPEFLCLLNVLLSVFVQLLSQRTNSSNLNNTKGLFVNMRALCNQPGLFASSLGGLVISFIDTVAQHCSRCHSAPSDPSETPVSSTLFLHHPLGPITSESVGERARHQDRIASSGSSSVQRRLESQYIRVFLSG